MRKIDAIKAIDVVKAVNANADYRELVSLVADKVKENVERIPDSGEDYVFDKKFTGLCPGWINAPSTLQPAHEYHGRKVIAMKEHDGYRVYLIGDETARTIHLPEGTQIVAGWDNK